MRAPDTIAVDDVRWRHIKDACRRAGIDADTVMVRKMPLRAELERLAARYIKDKNFKSPTERQFNEVINEGLAEIAAFRDPYTLKHDADGREHCDLIAYFVSDSVIKKVLQALDELETELRESLVAKPFVESNAAERARDHYWFLLVRLWVKIAPHAGHRKSAADFLQAATDASDSAVKNYLDRLPRKVRGGIADYPGYL